VPSGAVIESGPPSYSRAEWLTSAAQDSLAQPVGVGLAPNGNVIIFHRGVAPAAPYVPGNVVAFVDPKTGNIRNAWGAGFFVQPHGMHVDRAGHLWLTDIKRHQVFKFSLTGDLLLTLGEEGVTGSDESHFDQPTDVAVAPDGSIFVTDGYGNRRVMKFAADGTFLQQWGKEGNQSGEFMNPHAIDIAADGTIYVADRDNNRIQVFNAQGEFQKAIPTAAAVYACILADVPGNLLATDYLKRDTTILGSAVFTPTTTDPDVWIDRPTNGSEACRYHDLVMAKDGNLYLADLLSKEVHQFVR
jgi:peptidylamidoglycolate lyase